MSLVAFLDISSFTRELHLVDPGSPVDDPGDGGDLAVVVAGRHHRHCLNGDAAEALLDEVLAGLTQALELRSSQLIFESYPPAPGGLKTLIELMSALTCFL